MVFIMRLLLRGFSTAFLTHDNAFLPEWGGWRCSQAAVDESKRTETSARQTSVNFARVQRQLPTAHIDPIAPANSIRGRGRESVLRLAQRESGIARGWTSEAWRTSAPRRATHMCIPCGGIVTVQERESTAVGGGLSASSRPSMSEKAQSNNWMCCTGRINRQGSGV